LPTDGEASSSEGSAPPPTLGALLSSEGRIFFGRSKSQREEIATDELFVVVKEPGDGGSDAKSVRIILGNEGELVATVVKEDAEFVQLASKNAVAEPPEPIELTIYKDGSFEGAKTYSDGSKWVWIRTSYRPIDPEQFKKPLPFDGILGNTLRYRLKLWRTSPTAIAGRYRFPDTRADRELRGTIDPTSRRLSLDDVDPKLGGHIDATVIGHLAGGSFTTNTTIIGTYRDASSSTTAPRAFTVTDGFYPERLGPLKGGIFLSAQERYSNDCDIVGDHIFPVLDGAPADATKTFEEAFGAIVLASISGDKPAPQRIKPGSKIRQNCPKLSLEAASNRRLSDRALFTAFKLRDAWVAIDVEHYYQGGSASGHVWNECFVVDLATGEHEEAAKLLTEATIATFEARARKEALAALADAGPPKGDSVVDGMRDAAGNISLKGASLCIDDKKVVFGIGQHRIFGPTKPEYDRTEFTRLLPEGKLKALLSPSSSSMPSDAGPAQAAPDAGR
jgi:hypothetical protein